MHGLTTLMWSFACPRFPLFTYFLLFSRGAKQNIIGDCANDDFFISGSFDLHLLRAEDALVCRCQSDARASSATTFAATWQGDTIEEWPIFTDMLSYLPDVLHQR